MSRNPGIDMLRGISILLVITHHLALRIPLTRTDLARVVPHRVLATLNWSGGNAVTMFFTISGFLIARHTIERWGTLGRIDARAFYVRRLARIAPCLLLLVAVLSVLDLLGVPQMTITRHDQSLAGAVVSALSMWLNWYEGHTGYLPGNWDVLWSLSIEEAFYLGFPVLCLLLGRHDILRIAVLALLALSLPIALDRLATAPEIWQEKAYWPGMSAIATGIVAASVASSSHVKARNAVRCLGWVSALAIGGFLLEEPVLWHRLGNPVALTLPVATAALLLAFDRGWAATFVGRGSLWLRWPGQLSYEIYLTHMFVVFPAVWLFHVAGSRYGIGWIWFVPTLALSVSLGTVIGRSVARPMDVWIRNRLTLPKSPDGITQVPQSRT